MTSTHGLPLRVVLVDDEDLARQVLREFLAAEPGIEIAAECRNGIEAVKAVADLKPDLLFLDVQMPKIDGFEVLDLIGAECPVIFVTAYDEYALRAFDVHAVDYLLKPFGAERLSAAIRRARERAALRETGITVKALAAETSAQRGPLPRILVRQGADVHVISVDKVDYVESQDDYVSIKTGDRRFLKEQTLTELEGLLDPGRFVRIHRRYIVNITRLKKIESSDSESRTAVLNDGSELPISRAGYARLKELL